MFSNFIILLIVLLAIIYLFEFMSKENNEGFRNSYSNIYASVDRGVPDKLLYLRPPNPLQPNIDYQDYLNDISGYDSGTRGYDNPIFAAGVAAGLDTN